MYRVVQAELMMTCLSKAERKQNGAALILLVFILAIAMTTYLVKTFNSDRLKVDQEQRVMQNLADAKEALIAWAVSNSINPGQMPYPDRAGGGGYDGRSDCLLPNTTFNYNFLIGQLPIYGQTAPCISPQTGLGVNSQDAHGNRLWYAVSRNLVRKYDTPATNPIINSSIVSNPTYPWLRVLDKNGNPISNRVAAVVIAPDDVIGSQSRSNTATRDNFLDQFQIGATMHSNHDYDQPNEDFFIVDGLTEFNDKLVYITIDELMVALEKRVAREVVASLSRYYFDSAANSENRYYPYATIGTNTCVDGQFYGGLPLTPCATADIASYLPVWFTQNQWENFMFYAISSNCSQLNPGCVSGNLIVGTTTNVNALIISTGGAINTVIKDQVRPSTSPDDYLDSAENADGDSIYDAVGTPLTNTYNDQMFIVSP